ncbi:MAG: T9SS type A sorting domain-containing protein [Bacteroidetes bacterium]|nr:T9SS type A sorting domain-containing protein [Bacteroidota bacterium]
MKKHFYFRNFLVIFSCCLFSVSNLGAQTGNRPSPADTANYPYWIRMMQDPAANYFSTVSAFEKFWKNRPVTRGCGWKVFKRWQYIMGGRVSPDGTKPSPDAVYREWYKFNRFNQPNRSPGGSWISLGPASIPAPGPAGYLGLGRLNVVAFHPTDQNKLYVGSPSGGFWLTNDNGATWSTTTDNMPTIGVSAIAVDYSNPATILMGTGDRDHGDAPGMGVFKSADGGISWVQSNTGMGNVTVCKMIQHPTNALVFLAATTEGIYRSVNGGSSWSQTFSGYFQDICFKPGNPNVVYAESSSEFYRSSNNGLTFTHITSGLTSGQRGAIAVTPANPDYVYFLQSDNSSGYKGVYLSVDAGLTFSTRSTSPNILDWSCDGSDTGGQGWYDLVITADPNSAATVYVGGVNVWKSTDGGITWAISSQWYGGCSVPAVHADCHFLGFSPANGRLYAGNDGGIYYTANGGTAWTDCTVGMTIGQIYKIGQSQTDPAKTINGFQDNGTYTNTASGWVATGGGDGMECAVDFQNAAYTYHTIYFGSIFRKFNNAGEMQIAGGGVFGIDESGGWVTPFILGETDPKKMFVGYKNVWRCNDVQSNTPAWTKISADETAECSVLEQSPANPDLLYVVRWGSLQRTENANADFPAWISCTLPGGFTPSDLEAHPTEPNTLYATAEYRVYKSTDKGATWNLVPGTLPDIPVNAIVYEKNSSEGLYIGTQTGVLYRNSGMPGWVNFSSGLPVVDVRELEIYYNANPANNKIMVATYGRGLWKSDLYSPPNSPPVSNFSYSPLSPCPLQTVQFTDLSLNVPTSWNWSFSPNTVVFMNSTTPSSRNPQVRFSDNTAYTVTLTSTNAFGSNAADTVILAGGPIPPFTTSFESGTFPDGWTIYNPDSGRTWEIVATGGSPSGTKSAFIDFYNYNAPGETDEMNMNPVNLQGTLNPWLKFRVAYRRWGPGYSDGLKIFISPDCGTTWEPTPLYDKSGTDLATGPDQTDAFVPAVSSDWRLDSIDLQPYVNNSVRIKFQGITGWGNNLYIDDIAIVEYPVISLQDITIGDGQIPCYNATQTIRVAGNGTQFVVQPGGRATLVAGQNILLFPGVNVNPGGYLHGYLASAGHYCNQSPSSMGNTTLTTEDRPQLTGKGTFKLYPNPNNGNFTLEWDDSGFDGSYEVEVFGMLGERKLREPGLSGFKHTFSLQALPRGIYLVKVTSNYNTTTVKMLRQ